ncbi:MAG: hypothetical protein M3017_14265 [Actinomycetota bacterium]|nr:hypothetical protein [Actinomycetota bacterium]
MIKSSTAPTVRAALPDLGAAAILGLAIAMSVTAVMLVAEMEHVGALPMPLGVVFAAHLIGAATLGKQLLLPVGLLLHVGYLVTVTVIAAVVFRRRLGAAAAFGTAAVLWALAGVSVVPYVGWGLFGFGLGVGAALNLFIIHVLFGVFLWAGFWVAFRGRSAFTPAPDVTRA